MKRITDFIDSIKEKLAPEQEFNPWNQPDTPKPKITNEDIEEAVQQMHEKTPKTTHPFILAFTKFSTGIWMLLHIIVLYMMIGSPISGGVLVLVLINLNFLRHYIVLQGKNQNE